MKLLSRGRSSPLIAAVRRLLTDYALEHTGLKFLALLLALLLWFSISNQANSVTTFRGVPIEFQNIPDSMEIRSSERESADVRIRGLRDTLGDLRSGFPRLSVVADLRGFQPGKRVVSLAIGDVVGPPNIEVLAVEPSRFSITLERIASVTIPVDPTIEGTPPEGYNFAGVEISPPSVTVSGPESLVRKLKSVATETISIEGKTADFTVVADVDPPDASLSIVDNAEVSVLVRVRPNQGTIELPPLPVTIVPHAERTKSEPASVKVELTGDKTELQGIRPTQIIVLANVTGLPPGEHTVIPVVQMPDSVRAKLTGIKLNPEKVKITIR